MNERVSDLPGAAVEAGPGYAGPARYTQLEYEAVLANASIGIAFTRERKFFRCNPRFAAMFGWAQAELIGQPGEIIYPSPESFQALGRIAVPVLSEGGQLDLEWEMRRKDGSTFLARMVARAIDPENPPRGTVWILEDITERKRADEAVQRLLREQNAIFETASIGIAFVRNHVIQRCNARMAEMTGYAQDELVSRGADMLHADPSGGRAEGRRVYEETQPGGMFSAEYDYRRKDGRVFRGRAIGRRIDTGVGEQQWIWILEDISAQHAMREGQVRSPDELERLVSERTSELQAAKSKLESEVSERLQAETLAKHHADHDALTGLPNRRILDDRISQALALSQRNRKQTAVMFVDLDRFKQINDTLGHAVGDALLKEVAERLSGQLREGDTVCRIGGDEFVVVLPEVKRAADPANVAQKIIENLSLPLLIAGHQLTITPSLGISVYPDDGRDAQTLVRNADAAMYHAKEMGRANYQFFTEHMNLAAGRRIALEADVRRAQQTGELRVYYQPIAEIGTRRAVLREALLRWAHPARGLVAPGEFLTVAEDTGLILGIGERVLESACAWTMGFEETRRMPVSINLSMRQFNDPRLLELVGRVLKQTGLPAGLLGFEIKESTLMHRTEHSLVTLRKLKDMGVTLSVDDFGLGQSSLAYLKRFHLDRVKIDRSFVAGAPADADGSAVVSAIIALAHSMKLQVIAGGVEREEQLAFLSERGCDLAQGYLLGEPRDAESASGT